MKPSLYSIVAFCALGAGAIAAPAGDVTLHWLEGRSPAVASGVTWGVPWPCGKVPKNTTFSLRNSFGDSVPVQSWTLATWPDGSLKWSAHAVPPTSNLGDKLTLSPGQAGAPAKPGLVSEEGDAIQIDTGVIQCRLARKGTNFIEFIRRDGKELARDGHLVCLRRDHPDFDAEGVLKQEAFTGEIFGVSVEQRGPVRAVVKIEGKHAGSAGRKWLPFVVRLYFYAGGDAIRVMHTVIYDGDEKSDFVGGLGIRFSVPMRGELHNRHVRFAGEYHGLFAEAVCGITGLRRDPGSAVREAQTAGKATPPVDQWEPRVKNNLKFIPAFGDYTLSQQSADSFEICKRTKAGFTWLSAAHGRRSAGLGYIGGPEGGMAFGIRNFWESHPGQIDIRGAAGDMAQVTLWLWSPESRAMDLRFHHDDMGEDTYEKQLQGLDITYEDYEPGFATPKGVARTSEMMLRACSSTPSREQTVELADSLQTPPQLVCQPADYKQAGVFGNIWGLPDRSTPAKALVEDHLDWYFDHYRKEVEQRHWYGFWNFGDVMHTYDTDRHVWRYDVGGFAWDNSELSTDLWLWYSFLRTGRADIFRMAEAMTRHTGEVDVYHLGRFAGLGTRHGVVHWGDSAKQLRISTATNRRFYYYLTADERVGDLLWEQVDSARKLSEVPPGRKIGKPNPNKATQPFSMVMSLGTDWGSVAAAQLTAWERSGDSKYRDRLVTSMKSIAGLNHGWFSGSGGYDPETGRFFSNGDKVDVHHLNSVFGAFEINTELLQLLEVPEYRRTWVQYCELYNATLAEQKQAVGQDFGKLNLCQAHSRLTAYAAVQNQNPKLASRAWKEFYSGVAGLKLMTKPFPVRHLQGPAVLNPIDEIECSTNAVAQFGLAAIECLGLIGDKIPEQPANQHTAH